MIPTVLHAQTPGHPLHVIQRGYCRLACFFGDEDRVAYLGYLSECAERSGCAVHAYVLMGNHVHLLATPSRAEGAACLMRLLRERYTRYVGDRHERSEPVLEEHIQALPLRSKQHLLSCMQYIENNPVRAHLVRSAGDYRWSSHRANALGQADPLVTPHTCYYALGRTVVSRRDAYRALFEARASGRARRSAGAPGSAR
jgi:putative transposase